MVQEQRHSARQRVLFETVRKLLRRGATPNLQRILAKSMAADIAGMFPNLSEWEAKSLFEGCLKYDPAMASEVIAEMAPTLVAPHLVDLPREQALDLIDRLPTDDQVDILAELPEELASYIVQELEGEEVGDLMNFDPETAGGLMVTDFFALKETLTAAEAIDSIQLMPDAEMVFYLYCIDEEGRLTGVLSLRQLLTVPRDTRLRDLMTHEVIRVPLTMDQEEVARIVSKYNYLAVPVVDEWGTLVGIVTVDDVIDVIREEATEDFLRLAGAAEDDIVSRAVLPSVFARLPWLGASFAGGLLASEVIGRFEPAMETMGVLAGFIPVIMGMGGNVGTQASTLVVRGLATGKIDPRNVAWYLYKEVRVGMIMGLVYGLGLGTFAFARYGEGALLGVVVGVSISTAMVVAATWGSFVPVILSRLNIDPAVATGPFVTTTLDIFAILIYFTLATRLLGLPL